MLLYSLALKVAVLSLEGRITWIQSGVQVGAEISRKAQKMLLPPECFLLPSLIVKVISPKAQQIIVLQEVFLIFWGVFSLRGHPSVKLRGAKTCFPLPCIPPPLP